MMAITPDDWGTHKQITKEDYLERIYNRLLKERLKIEQLNPPYQIISMGVEATMPKSLDEWLEPIPEEPGEHEEIMNGFMPLANKLLGLTMHYFQTLNERLTVFKSPESDVYIEIMYRGKLREIHFSEKEYKVLCKQYELFMANQKSLHDVLRDNKDPPNPNGMYS